VADFEERLAPPEVAWGREGALLLRRRWTTHGVPIQGDAALEIGTPVPLFRPRLLNGPNAGIGFRAQYDVTRDGQRFLLNVPVEDAPTPPITVVLNWTSELKK